MSDGEKWKKQAQFNDEMREFKVNINTRFDELRTQLASVCTMFKQSQHHQQQQQAQHHEESEAYPAPTQKSASKPTDSELIRHETAPARYDTVKIPKLDFPTFDGFNPREWIRKCEQYFLIHVVSNDLKLRLVELHLRGEAELWLIRWKLRNPSVSMSWESLKDEVCNRFEVGGLLIDGFEPPSPLKVESPEVAHKLFDEMPRPPSIELNEENVEANDSGSKADCSTNMEVFDQIILKKGITPLLDEMFVRVLVKNGDDMLSVPGSAGNSFRSHLRSIELPLNTLNLSHLDVNEELVGPLENGEQHFGGEGDVYGFSVGFWKARRKEGSLDLEVVGQNVLENETCKLFDKIPVSTPDMNTPRLASAQTKELIKCKCKNPTLLTDNDGILMFIFDPGGYSLLHMGRNPLEFKHLCIPFHTLYMFDELPETHTLQEYAFKQQNNCQPPCSHSKGKLVYVINWYVASENHHGEKFDCRSSYTIILMETSVEVDGLIVNEEVEFRQRLGLTNTDPTMGCLGVASIDLMSVLLHLFWYIELAIDGLDGVSKFVDTFSILPRSVIMDQGFFDDTKILVLVKYIAEIEYYAQETRFGLQQHFHLENSYSCSNTNMNQRSKSLECGNNYGTFDCLYQFQAVCTNGVWDLSVLWGMLSNLEEMIDCQSLLPHLNNVQSWKTHKSAVILSHHGIFILNKWMNPMSPQFNDCIKAHQQGEYSYEDSILEFLACIYNLYRYGAVRKKMKKCEKRLNPTDWFTNRSHILGNSNGKDSCMNRAVYSRIGLQPNRLYSNSATQLVVRCNYLASQTGNCAQVIMCYFAQALIERITRELGAFLDLNVRRYKVTKVERQIQFSSVLKTNAHISGSEVMYCNGYEVIYGLEIMNKPIVVITCSLAKEENEKIVEETVTVDKGTQISRIEQLLKDYSKGREPYQIVKFVSDESCILNMIVGAFAGRGYNIDSSATVVTNKDNTLFIMDVSRTEAMLQQVIEQNPKNVNVIKFENILKELLVMQRIELVKINANPKYRAASYEFHGIQDPTHSLLDDYDNATYFEFGYDVVMTPFGELFGAFNLLCFWKRHWGSSKAIVFAGGRDVIFFVWDLGLSAISFYILEGKDDFEGEEVIEDIYNVMKLCELLNRIVSRGRRGMIIHLLLLHTLTLSYKLGQDALIIQYTMEMVDHTFIVVMENFVWNPGLYMLPFFFPILVIRTIKRNSAAAVHWKVKWMNLDEEHATWEDANDVMTKSPAFKLP